MELVIEKAKLIAQIGGSLKNQEYPYYDIGIAAAHFCLQAAELGLGCGPRLTLSAACATVGGQTLKFDGAKLVLAK